MRHRRSASGTQQGSGKLTNSVRLSDGGLALAKCVFLAQRIFDRVRESSKPKIIIRMHHQTISKVNTFVAVLAKTKSQRLSRDQT